jgi:hypothetical protein
VRGGPAAGGEALSGQPIDPDRPVPPRRLLRGAEQLRELIGHRLLVGITYLDADGSVTATRQFCGQVLDVADGVVVVERPGEAEPAVLPADAAAYRRAEPGSYTLAGTGETVRDPDFVSTWTLR